MLNISFYKILNRNKTIMYCELFFCFKHFSIIIALFWCLPLYLCCTSLRPYWSNKMPIQNHNKWMVWYFTGSVIFTIISTFMYSQTETFYWFNIADRYAISNIHQLKDLFSIALPSTILLGGREEGGGDKPHNLVRILFSCKT